MKNLKVQIVKTNITVINIPSKIFKKKKSSKKNDIIVIIYYNIKNIVFYFTTIF